MDRSSSTILFFSAQGGHIWARLLLHHMLSLPCSHGTSECVRMVKSSCYGKSCSASANIWHTPTCMLGCYSLGVLHCSLPAHFGALQDNLQTLCCKAESPATFLRSIAFL